MKVIYNDRAGQRREELTLARQAEKCLDEVLGESAETVTAEWDRTADKRGGIVFTLRLSDWTGWLTAVFTPDELQSPSHLCSRLRLLWGELLAIRSNKQLKALIGSELGDH